MSAELLNVALNQGMAKKICTNFVAHKVFPFIFKPGAVVHACSSSGSGGLGGRITSSKTDSAT